MIQGLELCDSTAGGTGFSEGTKILHATQCGQNKKKTNHAKFDEAIEQVEL